MTHSPGRRRIGSALSLLTAATVPAAAALFAPTGARAASIPACESSQLVTYVRPVPGGGSAGSSTLELDFSNIGGECTLRGYPGVSAIDHSARQIGRAATHSGDARTVTLKAPTATTYSTATAYLRFVDTEDFDGGCNSRIASGLKVYSPGATSYHKVPLPFPACTTGSATFLQVTAVGPNPG